MSNVMQEVYEKIREHFTAEDAVYGMNNDSMTCVYRGDYDPKSSVRCSVGVLLPDDEYDPHMDSPNGMSVNAYNMVGQALIKRWGTQLDFGFIGAVQVVHDDKAQTLAPIEHFVSRLDKLAADYGLEVVSEHTD